MPSPDHLPRRKRSGRRNGFVERVLTRYRSKGVNSARRTLGKRANDSDLEHQLAALDGEITRMTKRVEATVPGVARSRLRNELTKKQLEWLELFRKINRKPPEAGLAVPAEPPKGPKPKLGGAEAPLTFD